MYKAYFIPLIISSVILCILWILSIQQLCVQCLNYGNKSKTVNIIFLSFFAILLNGLLYVSSTYPNLILISFYENEHNVDILKLRIIMEAITVVYGAMLYHKWFAEYLDNIYIIIQPDLPKLYHRIIVVMLIIIFIISMVFYSLAFINFQNHDWIRYFYTIFPLIICLESCACWCFLNKTIKLLTDIGGNRTETNVIKFALKINIILFISSLGAILFNINIIFDIFNIPFNIDLITDISMSGFIIILIMPLIYWNFSQCSCCALYHYRNENSHIASFSLLTANGDNALTTTTTTMNSTWNKSEYTMIIGR